MKRTSTIHAFFETAMRQAGAVALRWRLSPGRWSALTVVVGDARKHLAALIALDHEAALREARACGAKAGTVEALCVDPVLLDRIGHAVDEVNRGLASYETIKKFRLLPVQFGVESGELTPTLKLRRKAVNDRFAREIEELSGDPARDLLAGS